jgi:hypothetical protein
MWQAGVVCLFWVGVGAEGTFPSGWSFPLVGEVVARPSGRPISRLYLHVEEEGLHRALRGAPQGEARGEAAYRHLEKGGIRFVLVQKRLEDLGPRARREMMLTMLRPYYSAEQWRPEQGDLARLLAWGGQASDISEVVTLLVDPGRSWEIVQGGAVVARLTDPTLLRALFQIYLGPRPGDPGTRDAIVRMLEDFTAASPARVPVPR